MVHNATERLKLEKDWALDPFFKCRAGSDILSISLQPQLKRWQVLHKYFSPMTGYLANQKHLHIPQERIKRNKNIGKEEERGPQISKYIN